MQNQVFWRHFSTHLAERRNLEESVQALLGRTPGQLARYNKVIFGTLFVGGGLFVLARWWMS